LALKKELSNHAGERRQNGNTLKRNALKAERASHRHGNRVIAEIPDRPKVSAEISELTCQHRSQAIDRLVDLMHSQNENVADRAVAQWGEGLLKWEAAVQIRSSSTKLHLFSSQCLLSYKSAVFHISTYMALGSRDVRLLSHHDGFL
jgi:hypothetical protein